MSELEEKDQIEEEEVVINEVEPEEVVQEPAEEARDVASAPPLPQPETHANTIANRLDEAIAAAKPVNRSADLVPLTRQFDKKRKQLKSVIAAAEVYHAAMLNMDNARMKVTTEFASMAEGSPIHGVLNGEASLVSTHQMALDCGKNNAMMYHQKIIEYLIEWEKTITQRVDRDLVETQKLNKIFDHYEIKVEGLRKKVTAIEKKGKSPPVKLTQKLDRNVEKLEEAWKNHERTASKLCNFLEEATHHGWRDLYPVVKASMDFHQECAREERDVFATLSSLEEKLSCIYDDMKTFDIQKEPSRVIVAIAQTDNKAEALSPAQNAADDKHLTGVEKFPDLLPTTTDEEEVHQRLEYSVDEEEEEEEEVVEIDSKADDGSASLGKDASFESVEENQDKSPQEAPQSPTGVMLPMEI